MTKPGSSAVLPDGVRLQIQTEVFDKLKCIICQTNQKEIVSSTVSGQKRVREATDIRKGEVCKRLKQLNASNDQIFYHCNNKYYKAYTMKNKTEKDC